MAIIYVTKNLKYKKIKLRNRKKKSVIFIWSKRRPFKKKTLENTKPKVHIYFCIPFNWCKLR